MTRKILVFLVSSCLVLLAACSSNLVENENAPIQEETAVPTGQPRATVTTRSSTGENSDNTAGYPGTGNPNPTPDNSLPATAPTEPYPGPPENRDIWILRPVALQCEDGEIEYSDLTKAVAALESSGINVRASQTVERDVCSACGCPTSTHYRVQIDQSHLESALTLGWTEDE